jgi:hypothetical protein
MTGSSRWRLWTPFFLAAIILAAWYFTWRAGAHAMRTALAEFAKEQEETGGVIAHSKMRAKGFPFFLRGDLGAVTIARGGWRWELDGVYLHAAPWAPGRIVISTSDSMRLAEPGGVWTIKADGARASIETAAGGWLFKAEAAGLEGVKGRQSIKTGRGVINVAPEQRQGGAVAVSFRLFEAILKNARGQTAPFRLDAALSIDPASRRLVIRGLDSDFGDARAEVSGAVAPDGAGYLEGNLAAAITNPAALADALRVMGVVHMEDARAIETTLAFVAAGGGGRIKASIDFANGETKLAGVKIGAAPRVGQP